jgi:hypothetical protein
MKPYPAYYNQIGKVGVPCEIHGWDDKSERFNIKYEDYYTQKIVYATVPYNKVEDYTWPSLSKHFETHGWV